LHLGRYPLNYGGWHQHVAGVYEVNSLAESGRLWGFLCIAAV